MRYVFLKEVFPHSFLDLLFSNRLNVWNSLLRLQNEDTVQEKNLGRALQVDSELFSKPLSEKVNGKHKRPIHSEEINSPFQQALF